MGLKRFLTDIFCGIEDDQIVDPTDKYLEMAPDPEGFTVLDVPKPWYKNVQRCDFDEYYIGSPAWVRRFEVLNGMAGSPTGNGDIHYGGFGDD